MTEHRVATTIRHAIGGDTAAIAWIAAQADAVDDAVLLTMAALLEQKSSRLDRAQAVAATSRDRQVVAIARAHLDGETERVAVLAREHLLDYPDSLIVSWIASDAPQHARPKIDP